MLLPSTTSLASSSRSKHSPPFLKTTITSLATSSAMLYFIFKSIFNSYYIYLSFYLYKSSSFFFFFFTLLCF
uniref:Uncharacterized protein n=1 Tax=Lepeophtheirus salmonis TaxID=72036 RepID=A0A0K2V8Z6_LEPSM